MKFLYWLHFSFDLMNGNLLAVIYWKLLSFRAVQQYETNFQKMYVYFFIVTTNDFLTFCLIPQLTLRYWLAQCTHSEKITECPQVIQNNWMPFQSVFYIYLSKVDFSSCFSLFWIKIGVSLKLCFQYAWYLCYRKHKLFITLYQNRNRQCIADDEVFFVLFIFSCWNSRVTLAEKGNKIFLLFYCFSLPHRLKI